LGYAAFISCDNLTSAIIGTGITTFRAGFAQCTNLSNVSLPNTLIEVGSDAFRFCSNLANITLPNNLNTIDDGAFYSCAKLNNITIPSKVTTIGDGGFFFCSDLTRINFLGTPPALVGGNVFLFTNANLKIYYLRFTRGWSSTFDGKPTIAFTLNSNIIKSGGTGKLTTQKRN
jgi:hypothetical protein